MREDGDNLRGIVALLQVIGIYALIALAYIGIPLAVLYGVVRFVKWAWSD